MVAEVYGALLSPALPTARPRNLLTSRSFQTGGRQSQGPGLPLGT